MAEQLTPAQALAVKTGAGGYWAARLPVPARPRSWWTGS